MSSKDWADEKADQIVLQWNRPTARPITDLIADALRQVSENSNAADLAALRAENAKLREALQEISNYAESKMVHQTLTPDTSVWYEFGQIRNKARAALAEPRKE